MPPSVYSSLFATLSRARAYATRHKLVSGIIALVVLGVAWYVYGAATSTSGQTRYVLGTVEASTIVSSVTGSGQIAANQSLDIQPTVSGQITYIGVTPGERVGAGALIAQIDSTDAGKAVRDAKANLASAELALEKTQQSANSVQGARSDLVSLYLDLPGVVTGLANIAGRLSDNRFLPANLGTSGGETYRKQALSDNDKAQSTYKLALAAYENTDVSTASASQLSALLVSSRDAITAAQAAVGSADIFLTWYENAALNPGAPLSASVAADLSTLSSDSTKLSSHAAALTSDASSLATEPLDAASSELDLTKAQNALQDAEDTLAKYYIRAPFAGTIGAVNAHVYDQAGSSALATLITNAQFADLSLNEVDAAKIAVGDKATLTFDAIPDLSLTGKVAVVSPLGAVTQGVVSYDVKISIDSQDSRIKTGMSVNASIQAAVHQNVLSVPSTAVKTQAGQSYVLAFDPPLATTTADGTAGILSATAPARIPVTIGISDDTSTEIISGLNLDEQIVVRSVTGTAAASTAATSRTTTTSGSRGFGGGGGAIRIP